MRANRSHCKRQLIAVDIISQEDVARALQWQIQDERPIVVNNIWE